MELPVIDATPLLLALAHVLLGIVALVAAKLLKPLLSPYRSDEELTQRDNPAYGLALAGYYAAVVLIFLDVAHLAPLPLEAGTGGVLVALGNDLLWVVGGVLALSLSRLLLDRVLIPECSQSKEIIQRRNVAAGAVECGIYLASGLVLGGAMRGVGGSIVTVLAFFALSQLGLMLLGRLYQRFAGYDVGREVLGNNLAAGLALGLSLVAIALLMRKAASGEFVDWTTNLGFFAFDAVAGFLLLLGLRWLTDLALLPNARIAEEIVRDRNINAGLIEGTVAVSVGAILLFVF